MLDSEASAALTVVEWSLADLLFLNLSLTASFTAQPAPTTPAPAPTAPTPSPRVVNDTGLAISNNYLWSLGSNEVGTEKSAIPGRRLICKKG